MKLIALDTLHVSSVGADNLVAGDKFEVADNDGELLIARGLAKADGSKAEQPHANKMEAAPANKVDKPAAKKATR